MRRRVMMILATAMLAGSFLAIGAQARGGGGGGHMGGGFGGGHMGGGYIGNLGGDRTGGLSAGHADNFASRFGGYDAGQMAHVDHEHPGMGRHRFVGDGYYDDSLDCPYDPDDTSPTWPYTCNY